MQGTSDDGLWKVGKWSEVIWSIDPLIPTWNQNTYQ